MTVYGDILFILNLVLDYGLLLATARVAGCAFVRFRLMLGALAGAFYAVMVFLPGLQFLSALPIRLGVGVLMVLIAFGSEIRLLRLIFIFGGISAALGGGVLALTTLGNATLYKGVVTNSADFAAVLVAGSGGCILIGLLFRRSGMMHQSYADVELALGSNRTRFRALVDTGNNLSDRHNHRVIVADWQVVGQILDCGLKREEAASPTKGFERLVEALGPSRVRLLSYRTVGVSEGLLLAVKPDEVLVNGRPCHGLLVAASAHPVSDGGEYQALIGADKTGGML